MSPITVSIPDRAKPHFTASKDAGRPHLQGGHIYPTPKSGKGPQHTLVTTDSYTLASFPVYVEGEGAPKGKNAKPLFVPAEALKDAGPHGDVVLLEDGLIEMFKNQKRGRGRLPHLYRMPEDVRQPGKFLELLDTHRPDPSKTRIQFGFNAELLFNLARSLGAIQRGWGGVKFTIVLDTVPKKGEQVTMQKPMWVESLAATDERAGILMPVRINV